MQSRGFLAPVRAILKRSAETLVITHTEVKLQNITRDIEVKDNLTMGRGEWGGDSEERGLQELL